MITRLAGVARGIYNNDRKLQAVLFAFMLLWYGLLLTFSWRIEHGALLGLTFNSMLDHLLHGQFYVDPQTVQYEGHWHDGHVYAYWGIWCALLRLPLWVFRRMEVDMTAWSCLAAVCLAGMAKVRATLLLRRQSLQNPMAGLAIVLMLGYILFGGSEIGYLTTSIYQEVMLWAAAFGAVFVYFAVKGLVNRQFDGKTLSAMSLCAGLALLTRATTGIGLSIAIVLLLIVLAVAQGTGGPGESRRAMRRMGRAIIQRRTLCPLGVLAVCIAVTGAVNYFRWGSPTTFVKIYPADGWLPEELRCQQLYGFFNLERIPFGLAYYFFPVWVLQGSNGQLVFEKTQSQLFDMAELPPSSFFLTDLLPFCFIVLLAIALWKRRHGSLPVMQGLSVAMGLLAPCFLMLMCIWMSYRYRMEFYPEIDFLALLGLYLTVTDEALLARFARWRRWMAASLAVSVVFSFVAFLLYDPTSGGRAEQYLDRGVVHYYYQRGAEHFGRVKAIYFHSH